MVERNRFFAAFIEDAEDFVISFQTLFLSGGTTGTSTVSPYRAQLVSVVKELFGQYMERVERLLSQSKSCKALAQDLDHWYADVERAHSLLPEAGLLKQVEDIGVRHLL